MSVYCTVEILNLYLVDRIIVQTLSVICISGDTMWMIPNSILISLYLLLVQSYAFLVELVLSTRKVIQY